MLVTQLLPEARERYPRVDANELDPLHRWMSSPSKRHHWHSSSGVHSIMMQIEECGFRRRSRLNMGKVFLGVVVFLSFGGCAQTESVSQEQRNMNTREIAAFNEDGLENLDMPTNESLSSDFSNNVTGFDSFNEVATNGSAQK